MDIELAEQRIFLLQEVLSLEEIQLRAMDRRMNAISGGIGGLLQRPKPEDVTLVGSQLRLDPFWHVAGRGRYVYERSRDYSVPVATSEVQQVAVHGVTAEVQQVGGSRAFGLTVTEHCVEETARELFIGGVSGAAVTDGASVVAGAKEEVLDPGALVTEGTVVLPPEQRSSFVVRTLLGELMKPVQADLMIEERMLIETIDLYYRPVRAFEFLWGPKDRRGVVEVDAITGAVDTGKSLTASLSRVLTRDAIFDIGADTAGLLVPGGSIAVKVAKLAIDQASKPSS
jgi:hypothetical protein